MELPAPDVRAEAVIATMIEPNVVKLVCDSFHFLSLSTTLACFISFWFSLYLLDSSFNILFVFNSLLSFLSICIFISFCIGFSLLVISLLFSISLLVIICEAISLSFM